MKKNVLMSMCCFLVCLFQVSFANELKPILITSSTMVGGAAWFNVQEVSQCETLECCFDELKRCRDGGDLNACNESYEQCSANLQDKNG